MTTSPPYRRVKVMGERATGTNFLAKLVYANFDVEMLVHMDPKEHPELQPLRRIPHTESAKGALAERIADYLHNDTMKERGGWKHACLTEKQFETIEDPDNVLFLCITRHPAMWVQSFCREPFSSFMVDPESLEAFVQMPWVTRPRDELSKLLLPGPAFLWRLKLASYLKHAAKRPNVKVIRHEDILLNPAGVLDLIGTLMPARRETWGMPRGYARDWGEDERGFDQIKNELPDDPWSTISDEVEDTLRKQIGPKLLEVMRYT